MRCYICGKDLEHTFNLVTMVEDTDRVYLVCDDKTCSDRIEAGTFIVRVMRKPEAVKTKDFHEMWKVPCPVCKAPIGKGCVIYQANHTAKGARTSNHTARIKAANNPQPVMLSHVRSVSDAG